MGLENPETHLLQFYSSNLQTNMTDILSIEPLKPIRTVEDFQASVREWEAAMIFSTASDDAHEVKRADAVCVREEQRWEEARHLFKFDEEGELVGALFEEELSKQKLLDEMERCNVVALGSSDGMSIQTKTEVVEGLSRLSDHFHNLILTQYPDYDNPKCPKCGSRSNMVLHDKEWVCHSTHIIPTPNYDK